MSLQLPSDTTLVAFLDGELSSADSARIEGLREREPALAERLALLEQGCAGLPQAFAPLLDEAPLAHLHGMLGALPATTPSAGWSRRQLLGGAAACLLAGVLGDRLWRGVQGSHWVSDGSWRGSVAQYMALYTAQTLQGLDESATAQALQLATVGEQLGIVLTPATVRLPGARLKRAQVLRYDADMLAQLVYLDERQQPLALCFVRATGAAQPAADEVRNGLNVVYWQGAGHAWMLAGRASLEAMHAMQQSVAVALG